jgi:hypothetical protein
MSKVQKGPITHSIPFCDETVIKKGVHGIYIGAVAEFVSEPVGKLL